MMGTNTTKHLLTLVLFLQITLSTSTEEEEPSAFCSKRDAPFLVDNPFTNAVDKPSGEDSSTGQEEAVTVSTTQEDSTDKTVDSSLTPQDTVPKCSITHAELVMGRWENGSVDRVDTGDNKPHPLLPAWVNMTKAKQGQDWARDHITLVSGSHIFGLMFVLSFPDLNAVLLFTNQSDTPLRAMKRYASTIQQVNTWYNGTLNATKDDVLASILRVRGLHKAAMDGGNYRMHTQGIPLINPELYERIQIDEKMWDAFEEDLKASDIPQKSRVMPDSYMGRDGSYFSVNQFQQAMTQYAFVGFPVLFPERLFLFDTKDEDLEAFNHFWAVVGYALGIKDDYNVALQPSLRETREYYQHIFETWYLPSLFNLDFYTKIMLEAQMKGFERIDDILTPKTLLLRMLRDIVGIPVPNMMRNLDAKDHAKMAQFHIKGLKGFAQKIKNDFKVNIKNKLGEIFG